MKNSLVLLFSLFTFFNAFTQNDTCLNFVELGLSFPPVGNITERTFTQGHMNVLGVDNVRFAEHWGFREPTQGS